MVGRAHTISLMGLEATPILIEAVVLNGLPSFALVGLADAAVNEARERLRAGFHHLGVNWPNQRLTVNLSPGDVTKTGTGFDLGIAVAILEAVGYRGFSADTAFIGELGLDGSIRPVRGVLPAVMAAADRGFATVVVPARNLPEALLVSGIEAVGINHLAELAGYMGVDVQGKPTGYEQRFTGVAHDVIVDTGMDAGPDLDLKDIYGQEEALGALEIAAAGGHHMLMLGPPGVGKSMLAERLPGILPDLTHEQAVAVAAIRSLDGQEVTGLPRRPPFAAPHHTATVAALVGGGAGIPHPGAITKAHHGVLFCDEFAEFSAAAIQSLRQPMEKGWVELSRVRARVRYPARFQLVAAANPCRCGMAFDGGGLCTCSARERRTYKSQLGGPVRDRLDIYLRLNRPSRADMRRGGITDSATVAQRVRIARARALARQEETGVELNAQLSGRWLRAHTPIGPGMSTHLEQALQKADLSMRGVDRILRLAWTLSDLADKDQPDDDDLALALALRAGAP
ncbi:MAG: YifB family Mg chelatase-like AAA ATPase [Actinomycetaceae bacterium]|nr:YifB family Mg chelatase-like AAA ATPase [Actinomycetaceae bacterium]